MKLGSGVTLFDIRRIADNSQPTEALTSRPRSLDFYGRKRQSVQSIDKVWLFRMEVSETNVSVTVPNSERPESDGLDYRDTAVELLRICFKVPTRKYPV